MPTLTVGADGQCVVEFRLSAAVGATRAWVVGDFNDWSPSATPMRREPDGAFSVSVTLALDRSYRFRYYLGEGEWENDWAADDYVPNRFGGSDSLICTREATDRPEGHLRQPLPHPPQHRGPSRSAPRDHRVGDSPSMSPGASRG